MEQELPSFPEHMSSPPIFGVARVTRSLVLCVCFVDRCLYSCTFWGGGGGGMSFLDLRILITPLISSSSFYRSTIFEQ